jgi:DNA-directed RNA polymerase specialized sigma24 family protein
MRREQREREFTEFYAGTSVALRRTAYVVVRDWHIAEDLTQQAFAKLYVAWPRIHAETRMAYARRTVVNECLSHLRRRRPETSVAEPPDPAVAPLRRDT